jgi:hypothetical protein
VPTISIHHYIAFFWHFLAILGHFNTPNVQSGSPARCPADIRSKISWLPFPVPRTSIDHYIALFWHFLAILGHFNTDNVQSGNTARCPAALQAPGDLKAAKKLSNFSVKKKKKKKKRTVFERLFFLRSFSLVRRPRRTSRPLSKFSLNVLKISLFFPKKTERRISKLRAKKSLW